MGNQKDTFRPRGRSRGAIGAVSGLGILLRAGLPGVPPWRSSARRPPYRSGAVPALHRLPPPRPYVWGRRSRPCGQNASRPEGSCQKGNHRDKTGKTKHPLRLPPGRQRPSSLLHCLCPAPGPGVHHGRLPLQGGAAHSPAQGGTLPRGQGHPRRFLLSLGRPGPGADAQAPVARSGLFPIPERPPPDPGRKGCLP